MRPLERLKLETFEESLSVDTRSRPNDRAQKSQIDDPHSRRIRDLPREITPLKTKSVVALISKVLKLETEIAVI